MLLLKTARLGGLLDECSTVTVISCVELSYNDTIGSQPSTTRCQVRDPKVINELCLEARDYYGVRIMTELSSKRAKELNACPSGYS